MTLLFQDRYRIKSTRYSGWNYADEGYYFVTICTYGKEEFFGKVLNGKMQLNDIGKIVAEEWLKTPKIRKNITLDEWIIMPNHIHGIIIIEYKIDDGVETHCNTQKVETHCNASLREYKNKFGPQSNNLSAIIRGFKGITTKIICEKFSKINFTWQSRFYDRIIRNERELNNVRNYIYNNPIKWESDKNNFGNLWI